MDTELYISLVKKIKILKSKERIPQKKPTSIVFYFVAPYSNLDRKLKSIAFNDWYE